jgi:hypothetical protein
MFLPEIVFECPALKAIVSDAAYGNKKIRSKTIAVNEYKNLILKTTTRTPLGIP